MISPIIQMRKPRSQEMNPWFKITQLVGVRNQDLPFLQIRNQDREGR